ncbi:hypothetical protein Ahy_B03g064545 isoform E [Arachis hypogaea]|uniref:Uncharacterized protein n=1 Tax=Arachis hypogaea TaxID=3818 RepID=A0A444ZZS8_ARAHY|nr:hypothetical protein Ahy_B03g064545 isoform E [Arachis hypogaea]
MKHEGQRRHKNMKFLVKSGWSFHISTKDYRPILSSPMACLILSTFHSLILKKMWPQAMMLLLLLLPLVEPFWCCCHSTNKNTTTIT